MVEEHAVSAGAHVEGDALVGARGEDAQRVGEVLVDGLADLVEPDELFAHAVDGFVGIEVEALDGEGGLAFEGAADAGVAGVQFMKRLVSGPPTPHSSRPVFAQRATMRPLERSTARAMRRSRARRSVGGRDGQWNALGRAFGEHGGLVFRDGSALGVANAKDVVRHGVDAQRAANGRAGGREGRLLEHGAVRRRDGAWGGEDGLGGEGGEGVPLAGQGEGSDGGAHQALGFEGAGNHGVGSGVATGTLTTTLRTGAGAVPQRMPGAWASWGKKRAKSPVRRVKGSKAPSKKTMSFASSKGASGVPACSIGA
jgi:hypothetical protein